jgi:integrase
MPKLLHVSPKYRHHKPSDRAVVTLNGVDHYLGPWRSKASKVEYDRLIGEWLANGRRPIAAQNDITIAELANRYRKFAESYYVKNGQQTGTMHGVRVAIRFLRQHYGPTRAADFGPLALKALQMRMVEAGHCRRYLNSNIDRIRRVFKWAVAEELVSPTVYQALAAVPGLRKGRTEAREMPPVRPVDDATVDATIAHLPPIVADMVRFQRLTGCRPAEVCIIRPCDVDTSERVWRYRPESHKTEHHGRERLIFIGPKAQDVLRPYLLRDKATCCFVPAESESKRNADKRASRRSPRTPSQESRRPKRNRSRLPGDCYTANSYRRAIHRACRLAFPPADDLPEDQRAEWCKAHQWHPNRLRHSAATTIRRQFGLEAAQVTLGHASADVSQIYAERDFSLAAQVMQKIG